MHLNARWNLAKEMLARAILLRSTYIRHIAWIFVAALYCRYIVHPSI